MTQSADFRDYLDRWWDRVKGDSYAAFNYVAHLVDLSTAHDDPSVREAATAKLSEINVGANAPTTKTGANMASTETATITIASAKLANPIIVNLAKEDYPLPVPGTISFIATSAAGAPTLTETITMSADIDGLDLVDDLPIKTFPIDLPGTLGPIVTALATNLDATITFAVTAA
jgi:hypothetical protein